MAIKRDFILSSGIGISANDLYIVGSTASTNSTSGALVVTGGVGIGGSVNVGGRVGIGTNLLDSTLNIRTSTAATPGIVIQGSTSQSASLFRVNSSVGGSFFEITNSGIVNIKTSTAGDFNSVPLQRWYSDDNSIVGVFQKGGFLYTGYGLGYVDGAGSQTLVHQWVPNGSYYITNWSKRMANGTQIMFSSSAGGDVRVYGDTNGSLTFQSYGTYTNNTMVKLMDPNAGTNQALFGVVSLGYTRSQLFSYGNLALNMTIAGSAGTDWDTTNLFRANVDTKTRYLGNLAVLAVDDTNRFVVGPYGNTTVSLGGTTTSTGLLVKAAASQSGNIIETQASTGVTNFYISPTGGASFSDNIEIKSAKELRFNNSGNTFYTGLKAGANASNTTYTLPIAFPGTGTSVLQSDTSGTLTWVAMTASGGGAGTVNNGSVNAIPYYPSAGTSITGSSSFTNVGTGISILYAAGTSSTSTGALVVTGGVGIGQSVSVGGRLQMFNGANYTAFISSASGNTVYTLPATSPATGSSVLQSTSAGLMSWVAMSAAGGLAISGSSDGTVQFKSGSSLGSTLSLFFDPLTLGLRISGFPGGETPSSTSAALKLEATVGSFNGSVNGTYYAANAPTAFAGDLMNLQVNAVSKFRIDNTGAITQNIGTNSTSTTSGAVQIKGGIGITGAVFVGESINATSTTTSTNTTTGALIVSGGVGIAGTVNIGADLVISGLTTLTYTSEKLNTKTSATGTVTHDLSTGSIFYHSSISSNFTANITNVPTTNDRAIGVTLVLAQGVTAYMSTALQIAGSAQTINWVNNSIPAGTASKVDIVGFSLIRTGSAWTVLGQYSTYG